MADLSRSTIIQNGMVLMPGRERAEPLDILLAGSAIEEIGPHGLSAPADAAAIDAAGKLLHPGLVNAHTHGHGTLAKGMGDRWTVELLLTAGPWISGKRMLQDKYLAAALNAAEMALKGCTACYDLFFEVPSPTVEGMAAVAEAYRDVGIRATIAPMLADLSLYQAIPGLLQSLPATLRKEAERLAPQPWTATRSAVEGFLKQSLADGERLKLALAPTIPLHCGDDLMIACRDYARDYGLGLHSHVGESKVQALAGRERYGKTLTGHVAALGLLGPHFTAAHAVWLDDEDMRLMGDAGANVAHNPGSNMRLGSGIADARAMLHAGVNLGIGTDGANSADNQNMYEALRLASFASKVRGPDYRDWLSTGEALQAATEGGARCLGFGGQIGRIEKGYQADIVFLDLGHVNWLPHNQTVNQLAHVEDAGAVESVMVGGRFIVRDRRLLGVDLAKLGREAEGARERLATANRDMRLLAEELQKAVGQFCIGLAARDYPVHRYGALSQR